MLEVKGELVFKTVAYHRAADAIAHSPVEVAARLPGGQAAEDRRASARRSATRSPSWPGRATSPSTSGSWPRSRRASSSCSGPGRRAEDGPDPLRGARHRDARGPPPGRRGRPAPDGQGAVREDRAADPRGHRGARGARPADAPRDRPRSSSTTLIGELGDTPGRRLDRAGRARSAAGARRSATSTCWPRRATRPRSSSAFTGSASVDEVLGSGAHKAAVRLLRGPQVDLMIMPPGAAGTYLIHFTGLEGAQRPAARARPRPRLEPVRARLPADRRGRRAAHRRGAELRTFPTEAEAYGFLDLPSSSPSCARTAARSRPPLAGTLPRARDLADLRGDLPLALGLVGRASTRSSRWPSAAAPAATPTRS